jgi:hypothetical protein
MPRIPVADAEALAGRALEAAGASQAMAALTARSLVAAEAEGQSGHGLSRVPQYAAFLRNGRADGAAVPAVVAERGGAALVDARHGLAYRAWRWRWRRRRRGRRGTAWRSWASPTPTTRARWACRCGRWPGGGSSRSPSPTRRPPCRCRAGGAR